MVNYTPTIPWNAPCRLVAERIDPKAETRRVVCTREGADLDAGIALMDQYIKNRNQRGWFIWVTGLPPVVKSLQIRLFGRWFFEFCVFSVFWNGRYEPK